MLEIYNTMIRKKEQFEKDDKNVKLFVCGPTVYNDAHIGHGRTYVSFDLIKSYLEFIGYSVFYIMNVTDLDDKIINRAKEKNVKAQEIANYYEDRFKEDMKILNVDSVNLYPKITYHINHIIKQIEELITKEYAYETDNGVYFETNKFKNFGKLANRDLEKLKVNRIEADPLKRDSKDFVLWKKTEDKPYYSSPWGNGRPGWHIEDTAITEEYFGYQYDIHGGGLDLIFPHHDAEIAQMESISGKSPMVNFWMHTGFLNVEGVKMSKSLGNFITIRDLLEKWDPIAYRLFVLSTHYRSPIDFSEKSLSQASKNLERLSKTAKNLLDVKGILFKESGDELVFNSEFKIQVEDKDNILYKTYLVKEQFFKDMNDDFNTPKALATVLSFTKTINSQIKVIKDECERLKSVSDENKEFVLDALNFLKDFNKIFKLDLFTLDKDLSQSNDDELLEIISYIRKELRIEKNYELSDKIRDKLTNLGLEIED